MRVLFLTHRLPYAPNRGDRLRAFHVMHYLRQSMDVDLLSLVHSDEEERHAKEMASSRLRVLTCRTSRVHGVRQSLAALAAGRPLTHALLDAPTMTTTLQAAVSQRRPDVVLAYCSGMARYALEKPLAGIPFVLDMVDVDSEKWKELGRTSKWPRRWVYAREGRYLASFEARAARAAVASLVVNERERTALRALAPEAHIEIVPNGIDLRSLRPPVEAPPSADVVFCGVMNYGPNEAGAHWLMKNVWPKVRLQRPDARLLLVGSNPPPSLEAARQGDTSIVITGSVDDVRPYLWKGAVSAAPLQTARGVQNKVLEAVAAGLPCVVTPVVAEGLPAGVLPACLVADDPEAFADALVSRLALSPERRRALAGSACLEQLGWEIALPAFRIILEGASSRSAPRVASRS